MRLISLVLVFLITLHSPPAAAQIDVSPEKAEVIRRAAERGDVQAQMALGTLFMTGNGVKRDIEMARIYLTRAAEQGNDQAQLVLGLAYGMDAGFGFPQDKGKATYWLARSASRGNPRAAMALKEMDRPQAPSETVDELQAKSEKGDAEAQYILASRYMHGIGVAKDAETARKWYRIAAGMGHSLAQSDLAIHLVMNGEKDEGMKWMEKAAERGVVHSQVELAAIYEAGKIVPADREKALFWYQKAAAQNDKRAVARVQQLSSP